MTTGKVTTREQRLRRLAKLCIQFARNMAYYLAAWDEARNYRGPTGNFWVTTDGNFLDMAVLEWCKLFGDRKAHQFWGAVVSDAVAFEAALLLAVDQTPDEFAQQAQVARAYRDKFLAHLDSELVMRPPMLDPMWDAVRFLYRHILQHEMTTAEATRVNLDIDDYYAECFAEAKAVYAVPQPKQA
jgi:hypothetical protein